MKKTLIILGLLVAFTAITTTEVKAQESILIMDGVTVDDSTVVNVSDVAALQNADQWSAIYVEALWSGLTATDTSAKVEIYNTLNGDFTDATDLDTGSGLTANDGALGTAMRTATITNSYFDQLRFVCDPEPTDAGTATLTLRIKPLYKSNYTDKIKD